MRQAPAAPLLSATDVLGAVLAGGRSSRMGQDKALVNFAGRPLIRHALDLLAGCGVKAVIAGASPESRPVLQGYAPVLDETHPGCGPLSGMEAALLEAQARVRERVLLLPIDVPLLPEAVLRLLLERSELTGALATMPTSVGQPQPLCAVLRVELLPLVTGALERSDYKVMRLFRTLPAGQLDLFPFEAAAAARPDWPVEPPQYRWFENLNTPADLARCTAERPAPSLPPPSSTTLIKR